MRRFIVVAATCLVSCGEGVEGPSDTDLDAALDDAANTEGDVGTVGDGGSNPLAALADEFDDPATLADWIMRDDLDGTVDIENGQLILTATTAQWHNNRESFFLYRMLEGDFVMRAHVKATRFDDPTMPPFLMFNAVGLLARDPLGATDPERWAMINMGFQSNTLGTRSALTVNGVTIQEVRATRGAEADLVVCRIGNTFRLYYLRPGSIWTNSGTHERPFPASLQVGIAIDALGEQPHLRAEVDWIRFAVPAVEDDCLADIPPAS